jgi:DNA-binding NtrC family response regulator
LWGFSEPLVPGITENPRKTRRRDAARLLLDLTNLEAGMHQGHRILVVAQTTTLASTLVSWLGGSQHQLAFVNTFAAGKVQLTNKPDLLITEVKLGEYNGLHLALRGQAAGIPAIVVGPTDNGFEHEAEQLGATYLESAGLNSDELNTVIDRLVDDDHENRLPSVPTLADDRFETLPWLAERPVVLH